MAVMCRSHSQNAQALQLALFAELLLLLQPLQMMQKAFLLGPVHHTLIIKPEQKTFLLPEMPLLSSKCEIGRL